MPVSFLSQAISSTPYISPIDPSMVYNAALYKQQQFDQGVQQVDSLLQNLSNQTILNKGHKEYYDQKVAQLTSKINDLGGADFSTRDTLQQIGNLSGLVSRDQRILGAIQDTNKIKAAQDTMDKWKSDPKKYGNSWAAQNQYALDQQILAYTSDTSDKASFTGQAEAYVDHPKIFNDRLTAIRKQIQQSGGYQTTDGKYIVTSKSLTDGDIRRIVEGEISSDPRIGRQIQLDANYQYRNLPTDTREFQQARINQLTQAKSLLEKQANEYNNEGLLALTTGTPQQQTAAREQHRKGLQQIAAQLKNYDDQISQAGSLSRDQQILGMHLDNLLLGYQAKYAFSERDIKADPNYSVNVAHQDRMSALSQADRHFNVSQYNQNQQLLGSWKHDFDMLKLKQEHDEKLKQADIELKLGLKAGKGGYSASTPVNDLSVVDLGASNVRTAGINDVYSVRDQVAGEQNKAVQDLLLSYIRQSNRSLADELKGKFRTLTDKDGNVTGFKYPTAIAPNMAIAAKQIMDYYGDIVNGRPVDPAVARQLDNSETRELVQKIRINTMVLKLQQQQVDKLNQLAGQRSGMSKTELSEMAKLQNLKQRQPELFAEKANLYATGPGSPTTLKNPYQEKLRYYEDRYKPALASVSEELGKTGEYNRGFIVSGESLKPGSRLQQLVWNRINNEATEGSGLTNAERRGQLASLQGKQIQNMVIDPVRQQIKVRAVDNKGNASEATVDFMGSADWNAVLPDVYRQQQISQAKLLKDELDKQGTLKVGKQLMLFTPSKGLPIAVTPGKNLNGEYDLGYMYQGVQLPIPLTTKDGDIVVPKEYRINPIGWLQNGLDNWMQNMIIPVLKATYGRDAQGKPIPNYTPTVHDFHNFFSDHSKF